MLKTDICVLTTRYAEALQWAFEKHLYQVRHNTETPYVAHLLGTSALVIEEGANEETAIAALLHDVLEDQPTSVAEVERNFGARVAQIVSDCTDASLVERELLSWRDRKIKHLERMKSFDQETLLVMLADKVSSLQSLADDLHRFGMQLFERSVQSAAELIWNYRQAYQIFCVQLDRRPLTLRLGTLIEEATVLAGIEEPN